MESSYLDRIVALRDLLNQHPLFALGILLVIGYLIGKLAGKVGLPEITGFIVAGLLIGDSVSGIVPRHMGEDLQLVTEMALGLIALTIGGEFYWAKLKRLGSAIAVITLVQLIASFLAVTGVLYLLSMPLPFSLLMGAIASATAPAATVAIVQALRVKGPFVDYLYGVVALDDAGAVMLFGLAMAAASAFLSGGTGGGHGGAVVLHAFSEVGLSVTLGLVAGFLIHLSAFRRRNENEILILTLGILFLSTAFAIVFELSPLLANMAAGAVVINLRADNHRIFHIIRPLTPPIYALFFVIAGTELRPEIVTQLDVLILGGAYIAARAFGKYFGVVLGARLSRAPERIRRYLGLCMFPQAGVAIGLVLLVEASPLLAGLTGEYGQIVETMVSIVLLSVFVNELVGPPLSKYALVRGTAGGE
jgi:Kef-type K+ transport system membrane component KefB